MTPDVLSANTGLLARETKLKIAYEVAETASRASCFALGIVFIPDD